MKLSLDGIEWGAYKFGDGIAYQFYINWSPNLLAPENRYWGLERIYYDGPHVTFGFWFFNIGWSTWHSLPPFEFLSGPYKEKWSKRPRWLRRLMAMEAYEPA